MPEHKFKHPEFPQSKLYKTTAKKVVERKLSFCFEFSSLKGGHICFDNIRQRPSDIIEMVRCLKNISQYSLNEIHENQKELRFHEVDLRHRAYLIDIYRSAIGVDRSVDSSQLPTLWQLEVFTDNKRGVAPRISFYILSDAVAKLVFFDYHHLLCSTIYAPNNDVPANWFDHYIVN